MSRCGAVNAGFYGDRAAGRHLFFPRATRSIHQKPRGTGGRNFVAHNRCGTGARAKLLKASGPDSLGASVRLE